MGFDVDDFAWPVKKPKKAKQPRGKSGGGDGTTVGMSVAIFGSAMLVALVTFGYVVYGHLV